MLKIIGDINFSDGFFDTSFGIGSSIKKGADPFLKLNRAKVEKLGHGCLLCLAL